MAETTQLNKMRQKKLRSLASKSRTLEEKPVKNYFYPKNNLYTRQEFELLDTIYSDDPPTTFESREEIFIGKDFWPKDKEELLINSGSKVNHFTNAIWFVGGVMLTSVIWLIYFQVNVHAIKTKNDTQIVFQKSAALMTDKTVDKEVINKLQKQKTIGESSITLNEIINKKTINSGTQIKSEMSKITEKPLKEQSKIAFSNWFAPKNNQKAVVVTPPSIKEPKTYSVVNGDSLWIIAKKCYSDPSQENINRIMKANNMKRVGTLSIGQKLVIPE